MNVRVEFFKTLLISNISPRYSSRALVIQSELCYATRLTHWPVHHGCSCIHSALLPIRLCRIFPVCLILFPMIPSMTFICLKAMRSPESMGRVRVWNCMTCNNYSVQQWNQLVHIEASGSLSGPSALTCSGHVSPIPTLSKILLLYSCIWHCVLHRILSSRFSSPNFLITDMSMGRVLHKKYYVPPLRRGSVRPRIGSVRPRIMSRITSKHCRR